MTQTQVVDELLEAFTVFGAVNGVRACTDNRDTGGFQCTTNLQRRLAAVLNDHAFGLFNVADFQNVFQGDRFEVESIGRIVVRGDRFGVTVDHDRFVTVFAHCHGCVHAAVVEFDTLTDTVRATAQDNDLLLVCRTSFIFTLVRGVEVSVRGFMTTATGVDTLVDRTDIHLMTASANSVFLDTHQRSQTLIREAFLLQEKHFFLRHGVQSRVLDAVFNVDQFTDLS